MEGTVLRTTLPGLKPNAKNSYFVALYVSTKPASVSCRESNKLASRGARMNINETVAPSKIFCGVGCSEG